MLVLSRHPGETICIGDEIEVTVVRSTSHQSRLAIKAPRHIKVHRKEVYETIQRERAAAIAEEIGTTATTKPAA